MADDRVSVPATVADSTAAASLLSLASSMEVMRRLLSRRDADEALVPADAALIRIAIQTAQEEAQRVGAMLSPLPADLTGGHRTRAATMLAAVADLVAVLGALSAAIDGLTA